MAFPPLQNDLLLRALNGEQTERAPVWMMRQAGRYLPDYIKLREKYTFWERVEQPELATEITVMPVDQVGVDAAIIFSDILVVLQALDFEVEMRPGEGPVLPDPLRSAEQALKLTVPDAAERLHYVMDALTLTRKTLAGRVPLIGFAGAPWTLLCYLVEGRGSKNFAEAKSFCYREPEAARRALEVITDTTIDYLNAQIKAGAQVVQVFDSWAGLLSPAQFDVWALPFLTKIAAEVEGAPVILFAKGANHALPELARTEAAGLGLDWTISPQAAREMTGNSITLQGNFDPSALFAPISVIEREAKQMVENFKTYRYIANLGHGIMPQTSPDHARAFVEAVKSCSST